MGNRQNQETKNEHLLSSSPSHCRTCVQRSWWRLLQRLRPQPTLQERVQHSRLRPPVLHPGGCRHRRRAHRAGHLRPLTIFAPTNDAFAKIPEDTLNGLLGDVPALTEILLRHVVPGKVVKLYSSSQSVDNAGGSQLTINGYSVASTAASASVIGKSVASDGRVYAINTVI